MFLKSLYLYDFRNISNEKLEFDSSVNFITGQNAQGKTNVVESIFLLATGKSFRTSEFRDLIKNGSEQSSVKTVLANHDIEDEVCVKLSVNKKEFLKNSKRYYPGRTRPFQVVLFSPEDAWLIRESPQLRRDYFDTFISQIDPKHGETVEKYDRILKHRNRLIQDLYNDPAVLFKSLQTWNEQLAHEGAVIVERRLRWIEDVRSIIPQKYSYISSSDGKVGLRYCPQCGTECLSKGNDAVAHRILELLEGSREEERRRGHTIVGPHRDDIIPVMDEIPMKQIASQGQQKTFIIALKMTEVDVLKAETGRPPVFILDDVSGELDASRAEKMFEYLKGVKTQTFLTSTDESKFVSLDQASVFDVCEGRVKARKRSF